MRHRTLPAMLAAALAATTAEAAVSVYHGGSNAAVDCYEAALLERSDSAAIGRCDEALEDPSTIGRNRVATHVNRGILYVQGGDYARALADYDRAIALDSAEPDAWLNKGLALLRRDRSGVEAVRLLTRAIELGTSEPAVAHFGRSFAHELNGDVAAAYADAVRAAELAPEWEAPSRNLERFTVQR